jgi:serine/threonine-protein kinase ATR
LFSPFWRSIAYIAVKGLQSRPQTTQLVADLLSMTVPDLLVATQAHSLPWLVLNGKVDVISRIANARGDNNKSDTCLDNMASIMALLLRQNVANLDEHIMGLLQKVSSQFKDTNLTECLRIEPIKIALELLKVGGEEEESKKTRVSLIFSLSPTI